MHICKNKTLLSSFSLQRFFCLLTKVLRDVLIQQIAVVIKCLWFCFFSPAGLPRSHFISQITDFSPRSLSLCLCCRCWATINAAYLPCGVLTKTWNLLWKENLMLIILRRLIGSAISSICKGGSEKSTWGWLPEEYEPCIINNY